MTMTKQELLEKIESQELAHISNLSDSARRKEICDWFVDEDIPTESNSEIIVDYMTDFMRWQGDKSEDELLELFNNII